MHYHYPIDETWSKQEIIDVVNFFSMVEKAYEKTVQCNALLLSYQRFKQIVPAKNEEKQLFAQFEKDSGYSSYRAVKQARQSGGSITISS